MSYFQLQCCGLNDASDWLSEFNLPPTCCAEDNITCTLDNVFNVGCSKQLFDIIFASMLSIGWIAIIFGVILMIAVTCACCLEFRLKNPSAP